MKSWWCICGLERHSITWAEFHCFQFCSKLIGSFRLGTSSQFIAFRSTQTRGHMQSYYGDSSRPTNVGHQRRRQDGLRPAHASRGRARTRCRGNNGEASAAVHTPKNLKRRSITAFEERPHTCERNRQRASVHGCFSGGNPSDIHMWWILWFSTYRTRRSLFACGASGLRRKLPEPGADKFACGANYPSQALKGGLFCICVESSNLT